MILRGRWVEAMLAAVATLVASWPIASLLRDNPWVSPTVVMLLVVALVGVGARTALAPAPVVVLGQVVIATLCLGWLFTPDLLWYGLPTRAAGQQAGILLQDAVTVLTTYAAPAPASAGVVFLIVALMALVAISVDALAVTSRSPAVAGIPLMIAFLVSVSNTGEAMHPKFFLATAVAWMLLLFRQSSSLVRQWSSADSRSVPVEQHDVATGGSGHAGLARVLGGVTVLAAVLLPTVLPHLPPTYFGDGLARSSQGSGGSTGSVSFTETLELEQDLNSRSTTPVIRYRTEEALPPPLRVTVTSDYSDGRWNPTPRDLDEVGISTDPEVPAPTGLDSAVERDEVSIQVVENSLRAPQVAVPHPLAGGDFGQVGWGVHPGTQTALVEEQPESYMVSYLDVAPDAELPDGVGTGQPPSDAVTEQDLQVDAASEEAVRALTEEVVGNAETPLAQAARIQNHLRSPTRYEYSLTLAPPVEGPDGDNLDPISHFLRTRQGYCVQFSSAMVMMARSEGIPARMAVGFLPGERQDDGARAIVAADAHSWPELYLSGLGWTRFEPTPGVRTGAPPGYSTEPLRPDDAPAPDPSVSDPAPAAPLPTPSAPQPGPQAGGDQGLFGGWLGDLARGLLVVAVLGTLLLIMPMAGRWRRETPLRRARTDAERVEGQWALLAAQLLDLGVEVPTGRTPRQIFTHLKRYADLDAKATGALGRVVQTLERSRYAPHATPVGSTGQDVRTVAERVRSGLPLNIRAHAAVLPRSGAEQLRDLGRAARRVLGRPFQALQQWWFDTVSYRRRRL